jgi:hypothetical protein
MTLGEFLDLVSEKPEYFIAYSVLIPVVAWLVGVLGKNEGHLNPWRSTYSVLIYFSFVPGIFAVGLLLYRMIFENKSIMEMNLVTTILPAVSMLITTKLIRRNVHLRFIPGFGKLSGLIWMISCMIVILWVLNKTRIVVFTHLQFHYFILIIVGVLFALRIGLKRLWDA